MAKNVFILGAGFSHPAGTPLIYNFIPLARKLYENEDDELKDSGYFEYFDRVFSYKDELKKVNATFEEDFDDIEKLYSYSDFECRYIDSSNEKLKARKSLIFMIVKTLDMLTKQNKKPGSGILVGSPIALEYNRLRDPLPKHQDVYDVLALILSGRYHMKPRSSSVITFNYDVILDDACIKWGIKPHYCLPGDKQKNDLHLKILKLHGSANWMTCSNPNCEDGGRLIDVKLYGKFLHEYKTKACPRCKEQQLMPLIVPPSWDKTQFKEILSNIWSEAGKEIREAKRVFIIGYSFPDADLYFRYLLYTTLSFNKNDPEIYIVDIEDGYNKVASKLKDIFTETYYDRHIKDRFGRVGVTDFINQHLRLKRGEFFT